MRVSYFRDTDTLYIAFRKHGIAESRDMGDNAIFDFDDAGSVCAFTIGHASQYIDVGHLHIEGIEAAERVD